MRTYKSTGAEYVELRLKDNGEFALKLKIGKAPDGTLIEHEGTFDWKGPALALNCQFKVETRLTEDEDDEPTAVRNRCRDVFPGTLVKDILTLKWMGRTDALKQE